jgi:hypothetical protein
MSDQERAAVYRSRADEIRTYAKDMSSPASREALLEVARRYEALARGLEAMATKVWSKASS